MKSDPRYTSESVFDTFPWPQNVTTAQIDAVAKAGRHLRQVRDQALQHLEGGLRALYRTLDLPGKNPLKDAHSALDAAVIKAYKFSANKELLDQLLQLNYSIFNQIIAGASVNGPGVPSHYSNTTHLITNHAFGSKGS